MSGSQERLWSNDPNAPKIPYYTYVAEKSRMAGISLSSILYGILVVLFFQCMAALFSSTNRRREGIRWCLVSYTVLMFSFATILLGTGMAVQFDSYIDNREYPGVEDEIDPGPVGYRFVLEPGALLMTDTLMFQLNYWLADACLIYRCHAIFARNLWAIALPCLLYLASVVVGIMVLISQAARWGGFWTGTAITLSVINSSITVSLNILLTLMIVVRLVLHGRSVRVATGSSAGLSGLYKTIATMFIESSALYAGASALSLGLWATDDSVSYAFLPARSIIQVIAPLLIIKRIANRSAFTSDTITGGLCSFRVRSQGEPMDSSVLPANGDPVHSVGEFRVGVGAETLDKI